LSLARRHALAEPVARVALRLRRAEASIALLDRVRPLNLAAEQARLLQGFESGARPEPALEYAARPALGDLRRELTELAATLDASDVEQRLLAERALELELEASLAERVGDGGFAELAARRFPLPPEPREAELRARQFLTTPHASNPQEKPEILHLSDDQRDPESLWSLLSRLLSRERFAVRIEIVPGLVSLAGVADGVVRIRPGAKLTARVARRIALHEVLGHVAPRVHGQELGGVFMAGTAGASEDEEGRAILLEERAGLLEPERRKELGRRYLAAESVRRGAAFWDTVTLLGQAGASAAAAIELGCRAHRGGGLGRELVYLTGYLRVAEQLLRHPELERLQERGRISLSAARELLEGSIELDDDGNVV
jgi:hypothetical protein